MICLPLRILQVEIMMALEEKFDLQLDEEGEYAHLLTMLSRLQLHAYIVQPTSFADTNSSHLLDICPFATHAGAEKITTVQEAADLISQQIK